MLLFYCVCSSYRFHLSEEELPLSSSKLLDWMVKLGIDFNKDGVIDEKDVIALMNDDVLPYYDSITMKKIK